MKLTTPQNRSEAQKLHHATRKPLPSSNQSDIAHPPDSPNRKNSKSQCACGGSCPKCQIQAKLKIGAPNDVYEQEADRVADAVMRMPESKTQQASRADARFGAKKPGFSASNADVAVQRQQEKEEELIQAKPLAQQISPLIQRQPDEEDDEELIQAKSTGEVTPAVTPAINTGIQLLQGGGQPLSKTERGFFEPRFGADFSGVRVHSDSRAAGLARSVNARAFTHGNNVVFGAGEYSSGSLGGKRLLAHELTHVVQQGGSNEIGFKTSIESDPFGTHALQQRRIPSRIQRACDALKTESKKPQKRSRRCLIHNPIDCCPEEDSGCKKLSTAEGAYSRALAKLERAVSRLNTAPSVRKEDDVESARLPSLAAERYFGIDTTVRRKRGRKGAQERERVTQALEPLRATLGLILAQMKGPAKLARKQPLPEQDIAPKDQDIAPKPLKAILPPEEEAPFEDSPIEPSATQQLPTSRPRVVSLPPSKSPFEIPPLGSPFRAPPLSPGSSPIPGGVPGAMPGAMPSHMLTMFEKPKPCQSADYEIVCGFEPCEGGCLSNYAFFRPSIKRIVLCDLFFYGQAPLQQEATIIHEVAHSVLHPGKFDVYSGSRLFPLLGTVKRSSGQVAALDNPDSIAAFVLLGGGKLEEDDRVHHLVGRVERAIREPEEDSFENVPRLRRKAERQKAHVRLARGLVDEKIRQAVKPTMLLASNVARSTSWDSLNDNHKATLALLRGDTGIKQASDCNHTRFPGLATGRCPWANLSASPTLDDIRIIEEIWSNLDTLRITSARKLTIDMDATGSQWDAAADQVSFAKPFFEVSAEDRVSLLIEMVVTSNSRIGSFAPSYVRLLKIFNIL